MFGFLNELALTPMAAMGIYMLAGVVLLHDMKRIRWYALSILWVSLGSFDRGFLIETTMLSFTYVLTEIYFNTYHQHNELKKQARELKKNNE